MKEQDEVLQLEQKLRLEKYRMEQRRIEDEKKEKERRLKSQIEEGELLREVASYEPALKRAEIDRRKAEKEQRRDAESQRLEQDVTGSEETAAGWITERVTIQNYALASQYNGGLDEEGPMRDAVMKIKSLPFSSGTFRMAFWARIDGKLWIAKRLFGEDDLPSVRREILENIEGQLFANSLASHFTKALAKAGRRETVRFVPMQLVELRQRTPMVLMSLEEPLPFKFRKYTNLATCVSSNQDPLPRALAHWSWAYSRGRITLADLQGCSDDSFTNYILTDPGLHVLYSEEEDKRFGDTNGGVRAMNAFFSTHTCNEICKALALKPHPCQTA